MKPLKLEVWRVRFKNVTSYQVIARDVDAALRKAKLLFKINHRTREPITSIEFIGTIRNEEAT